LKEKTDTNYEQVISQAFKVFLPMRFIRFCKLAGCIVVNYSENDQIKAN